MYISHHRTSIPILLGLLIRFASGEYSQETGIVLAAIFLVVMFLGSILFQQVTFQMNTMAMRMRVALISLAYEKVSIGT